MRAPEISIIVPVYQAEKWMRRCLDSIVAQSFADWECILVDDGSTDNSGRLCDEYAANDSRFRVIHQPNGGVAVARQTGLDVARGKYVIHVDPDDWVDADYLKAFYDKAEEVQADMVFSDFIEIESNERVNNSQRPSSLSCKDILEELIHNKLMGSCWNRLVKRTCFEQWNVKFHPAMRYMEDIYINCLLLANDIKVAYIPEALITMTTPPVKEVLPK
jgi:glycosyltransferase involved in cell wall biosynthesis